MARRQKGTQNKESGQHTSTVFNNIKQPNSLQIPKIWRRTLCTAPYTSQSPRVVRWPGMPDVLTRKLSACQPGQMPAQLHAFQGVASATPTIDNQLFRDDGQQFVLQTVKPPPCQCPAVRSRMLGPFHCPLLICSWHAPHSLTASQTQSRLNPHFNYFLFHQFMASHPLRWG